MTHVTYVLGVEGSTGVGASTGVAGYDDVSIFSYTVLEAATYPRPSSLMFSASQNSKISQINGNLIYNDSN